MKTRNGVGRLAAALVVLTTATAWGNGSPAARPALTLEDLASAEGLSAPALSPDGREFALVRDKQIVLVPAEGGWPAALTTTSGAKSGLDWSPDGRALAFSADGAIWSVPSAGGAPVRLTEGRAGAGDPRRAGDRVPTWSPSGRWILFETGRRGNVDLATVSADGLTVNLLTSGEADEGTASWSPDGTRIAYVERSEDHFSGRLRVAEFDDATGHVKGEPRILYEARADRGGGWSLRRPAWSRDGRSLVLGLQDSGWDKLYLIPAAGGPPRALTEGDGEDGDPAFSPDGKWIAFVSNRGALEERHVWVVSATGGAAQRLAPGSRGTLEWDPQWSADGTQVYFLRAAAFEPAGLATAAANGKGEAKLLVRTQPRNFAATGLAAPEVVRYKGKDGLALAAILNRPAGFKAGTRYPAVLWIHGGPEGQDTLGFDAWALYLAQEGYVVLRPNYRGSSGYGEKFRNLNVEDSGGGELDDVVAGLDYLVAQGLADPARVAIGGGSHGGTMVAYAVTKRPDLFKAGLELYGVTNRATYNERTNRASAVRWIKKMGGTPDEKPEVYRKANILPDVPKITAPLLILHGEDDPQVPPYESVQLVNALKKAGKTYVYFTYPKELHGFAQREHKLDAWQKETAFLRRYLQPEYGLGITSTQDVVLGER